MKIAEIALAGLLAAAWAMAAPPAGKQPAPQTARKGNAGSQTKASQGRYYSPRYSRRWTPPRPVGPLAPSPERYKEIQQALVDRGYLAGEPTGEWKQDSVDALKRFQQDQKLEISGKLDSLSIIALGLGPKRPSAEAPATPAASAATKSQP